MKPTASSKKRSAPPAAAAAGVRTSRHPSHRPSRPPTSSKAPARASGQPSLLQDPVQWLLKLLGLSVRRKRREGRESFISEAPASTTAPSSTTMTRRTTAEPRKPPPARESLEAREMGEALADVLNRHVTSRKTLPHLDAIERALRIHGLQGLNDIPLSVLQTALRQLEGLVTRWTGHLAALRSRLALTIIEREQIPADSNIMAGGLSTFGGDSKVQVGESSVTAFMEVSDEWEKSLSGAAVSAAREGTSRA